MEYPLFAVVNGVVPASGTVSITLGPGLPRERWNVESLTVTALNSTVSVSQYGRVVDSTANDPRPTVTTDTPYQVGSGTVLTVTWTGLPVGTAVQALATGTRLVGYDNAVH